MEEGRERGMEIMEGRDGWLWGCRDKVSEERCLCKVGEVAVTKQPYYSERPASILSTPIKQTNVSQYKAMY